jgi:hypothetical protein
MDVDSRLQAIEARLAIQQLPIRYAIAIDSRDLDLMAEQWVPDVWMGKAWGEGRDAVRKFFGQILQGFYRSIHMIVGHRIDLIDAETASGMVYCRAEHEALDHWVAQAIVYEDTYRCFEGTWGFARRVHHHWYSTPMDESPTGPLFEKWPGRPTQGGLPDLPHVWPSWAKYWENVGSEGAERVTRSPRVPTRES